MAEAREISILGRALLGLDDRRNPNPFVACFSVTNSGAIHTDTEKVLIYRHENYPGAKYHYRYRYKGLT